jgi:hypothetical protein
MARPDPGPDASPSAAPPDWYSHGLREQHLDAALAAGHGVVLLTAHLAWSPPHGHA